MATPIVPPRPTRANGTAAAASDTVPQIPARPARKIDPSPIRSPLNELPNPAGSVRKTTSRSNLSVADVPPRPPSVQSFPSVGQEGSEYASYDLLPPEARSVTNAASTTEQTRNVAEDMPLHAPRASLPQSTAKSRIETVTGTDSTQAAAAGIGKARPDDDVHKTPADSPSLAPTDDGLQRSRSIDPATPKRASFSRPASGAAHHGSRPASTYGDDHEHGIPQIGLQIPLLKNAGDVQAPSPGPTLSQHTPGVGFFNDGSTRAHQRRRSGKHEFGPPGSYGLHSHGYDPHDQFERDWYAKHPDRAMAEGYNAYGSSRPESALSSAALNRMVTQTDDGGAGAVAAVGTPGEEIGYSASDVYSSRPRPAQGRGRRRPSSGSQPAVESPLRRTSFPFHGADHHAVDDDVVHVDAPEYRISKVTGGGPADDAVDLGAHAGNTATEGGWFMERGAGTPILASDEVLKRRESATMQPAVNPEYHYDEYDSDHAYDSRRSSVRIPSRPSSRPGSRAGEYHGGNLHRFISHDETHHGSGVHTPLEEIEEYEPLIPEGEETSPKPKPRAAKKQRPGLEHHHFPSQDIWEDTPSSLQFSTTVETPDEPMGDSAAAASKTLEVPDQEQLRRIHTADETAIDSKPYLKPHYAQRGLDRPGVQRFPSKDIWEDTPSSLQFSTTVETPQMDETKGLPDDRPTTYSMPGTQDDNEARSTTGYTQNLRPVMPARPKQRSKLAEELSPTEIEEPSSESTDVTQDQPSSPEKGKAPPIPDRPKPTVPTRPARAIKTDQADGSNDLTKTTSADGSSPADAASPPAKVKPAVPARPGGEKIAALKAGFMNDLNNRLKIGPQAPPTKSRDLEPEAAEEAEKAPLADARKSRAKGPARRKPASASPSSGADMGPPSAFSFSTTFTMWAIDESEELQVPPSSAGRTAPSESEKTLATNAAANIHDPSLVEEVESPPEHAMPLTKSVSPPVPELLSKSPEERKSMADRLEAELAEVGAAPAPTASGQEATHHDGVAFEGGAEKTSADMAVEEESSTVVANGASTS